MTPDQPEGGQPDAMIQLAAGLTDTPFGQKLALTITVLLGADGARNVADTIRQAADQMSASGLVIARPNGALNGH